MWYGFSVEPVVAKSATAQASSETAKLDVKRLMEEIATFEGFYKEGTLAQRNNNPGNLKYVTWSTTKIGLDQSNFATYATAEDGWNDLETFLRKRIEGEDTLDTLMSVYAPPRDNDTENYLQFLSNELGIPRNIKLKYLL